jgi:amino acid transporter/nucleotide-binding universal stress UspA family protein
MSSDPPRTGAASGGNVTAELSRDLGLFHVTMMGLGMMIGAGVFVGIGLCTGAAGPGGLMTTFALNGLIALFSAMSFAELSSAIPRAGGTYNFARIGFGRPASFIAGWMEWLAASAAGGLYAIVLAKYVLGFFYGLGWLEWMPVSELVAQRVFSVVAALVFVYINFRGSSETGKYGALFTVGQMLFVLSIGVAGTVVFALHPERLDNFDPFLGDSSWWALLGSMGIIYVAFEGFEVIAQAGDETIEPKKNIPKAILYSVFAVTLTYLLVAFATLISVPRNHPEVGGMEVWRWLPMQGNDGDKGFAEAVGILIPGWGKLLVTLAVIFSATSALNATIYSASRSAYALGRDRMLPAIFSRIHSRTRVPYVALGLTSVIVIGLALLLDSKDAAATASIMFLLLFFLVNVCVIRIRRQMGDELEYGFIMPLFPLFPILAIVCQAGMAGGILHESWVAWVVAALWLPVGALIYRFYSRSRAIATEDEIHVFRDEKATDVRGDETRIMVAVANPANAISLVQSTYRFCQSVERPHVELIHMVPVPSAVALRDAERYMYEGREAIMESMLYLAPEYPISSTLRYCRNPARGITSAVAEKDVDTLILGWHGRSNHKHFTIGSTIDQVIERAPCNVVMMKNTGGNRQYNRVLVPLAGGPNGALALRTASVLASDEAEITAFTVHSKKRTFDVAGFVAEHAPALSLPVDRVRCEVAISDDVTEAILHEAEEYDLVVLGSTREPLLLRHIGQAAIPETVARRCEKPLVMCRAAAGLRSWIRRYI